MKDRSPLAVFVLSVFTCGIYSWYWIVKTKGEMNKLRENVPTAWIWLIPFIGVIWWQWKYPEAVGHVTKGKLDGILVFLLIMFIGVFAQVIIQDSFNKIEK